MKKKREKEIKCPFTKARGLINTQNEKNPEQFYWLAVRCANCSYNGQVAIKKHILLRNTSCPECACEELVKIY